MSNSSSSSSSDEEELSQFCVGAQPLPESPSSSPPSSPSAKKEKDSSVLSIEEEKEAPPMPKKKESKKRTKKDTKAEAEEGERVYEDDKEIEIDVPKTLKRVSQAPLAKFTLEKTNPRERTLIVDVPGKGMQSLYCKYIDFPDDEIVPKLKTVMEEHELKFMSEFEVAQYAPGVFWNAIYHWKSIDGLEQKLFDADIPNGKRHQKRRKTGSK